MNKVRLFGIDIDPLTCDRAVGVLEEWLQNDDQACRFVVTPNVDHVVMLDSNPAFRDAYANASLVLTDGRPVAAIGKLLGRDIPETVPGSDLAPALFDKVSRVWVRPLRVFLLGAGPGVADRAASKMHAQWRNVSVVGTYSPPFGFERDEDECQKIIDLVASSNAELLIVGLGAPKQELWINRHAKSLPVKVALCIGATIDFIAGEKPRAPNWMRRYGVEWVHRMMSEPRRLVKRYAKDAFCFPFIVLKEVLRKP